MAYDRPTASVSGPSTQVSPLSRTCSTCPSRSRSAQGTNSRARSWKRDLRCRASAMTRLSCTSAAKRRFSGSGSRLRSPASAQVSSSSRLPSTITVSDHVWWSRSGYARARARSSSKGVRSRSLASREVRIARCPSHSVCPPSVSRSYQQPVPSSALVRSAGPGRPVLRRSSASGSVRAQWRARSSSSSRAGPGRRTTSGNTAHVRHSEPLATARSSGVVPSGSRRSGSAPYATRASATGSSCAAIARHSTGRPVLSSSASGAAPASSRSRTRSASPCRTAATSRPPSPAPMCPPSLAVGGSPVEPAGRA